MTVFVRYEEVRCSRRPSWSGSSCESDWMKIMGVSSVGEHGPRGDGSGRPARELFQSLEIYLLRSGYEAIVSESFEFAQSACSTPERPAE